MGNHVFTAGFLFAGLGAGARGFDAAIAKLGADSARFKNLGGVDFDPDACKDFELLTGARSLCADIAKLQPAELRAFMGPRRPDAIFTSPPCKGMSRLLGRKAAAQDKYRELNALVFKGIFLACESWPDDPPPLFVLENVPGITSRGAEFLDQVRGLLHGYGYRIHEQTHDCGEVGGLAQHRRRFLLVARREKAVKAYVYQPPKQRVRGCGEVLGELPMPNDPAAGPLHKMPKISWLNWVRLALIPAGGDWRDLPKRLEPAPENPDKHRNKFAVTEWDKAAPTVTGASRPGSGGPSVADPRIGLGQTADAAESFKGRPGLFGVNDWGAPTSAVTGSMQVSGSNAPAAVADPRLGVAARRRGTFGVLDWEEPSATVTGSMEAAGSNSPASVADPRVGLEHEPWRGAMGVIEWEKPAPTVRGASSVRQSRSAVADPRLTSPLAEGQGRNSVFARLKVTDWNEPSAAVTGPGGSNGAEHVADPRVDEVAGKVPLRCSPHNGAYGVMSWEEASATITGSGQIDNTKVAVADPRKAPTHPVVIIAADGTWHRPLTDLELAALQSIPPTINGKPLQLSRGGGVSSVRERIGNAVPGDAAEAIAVSLLKALLASALGTWFLSSDAIWVRDDGRPEDELDVQSPALLANSEVA